MWNTGTTYSTTDPIDNTTFNGIGDDLRTWGGNVDANANSLTNLAGISGSSSVLAITSAIVSIYKDANILGSGIALAQLGVKGATDVNKILALGYDTTAGCGIIQAYHNGVATKPLVLQPSGANVAIGGISAPADLLHIYGAGAALRVEDTGSGNAAIRWKTSSNTVEWINQGGSGFDLYDITNSAYRIRVSTTGKVGIGRTAIAPFAVAGLATYASNAAALAGGLTAGDFYTDGAGDLKVTF